MNGSHHQSPDSDSHSECDSISNPNHSTTQDWRLESTLEQELAEWKKLGLERRIRNLESTQGTHIKLNGRNIINFSSNNYLGISNHPEVVSRLQSDALLYGSGAGSSRLVCGSQAPHQENSRSPLHLCWQPQVCCRAHFRRPWKPLSNFFPCLSLN